MCDVVVALGTAPNAATDDTHSTGSRQTHEAKETKDAGQLKTRDEVQQEKKMHIGRELGYGRTMKVTCWAGGWV